MIEVRPIPVELEARGLAETGGIGLPEAQRFLAIAQPFIETIGVFDEVPPDRVLPPELTGLDWGATVMVGLAVFTKDQTRPDGPDGLWQTFLQMTAGEVLDFMEYRIRLFLKPDHRQPSERLIPGCPALPLSVNAAIFNHFQPDHTHGLHLFSDGRLGGREGVAFLYPTSELVFRSKCDACTLKHCPSSLGLQP